MPSWIKIVIDILLLSVVIKVPMPYSSLTMEQHVLKNVNICLNMNIYSFLESSGAQRSNQYLNIVHISNTGVNYTSVAA